MKWAIVGVLILFSASVQACGDTFHTTVTLGSKHLNTSKSFNEFNPGLGVECHDYYVGAYYNSLSRVTVTLGKVFQANDWAGIRVGLATGYDIPIVPYVAGYVRLGKVELNFLPATKRSPAVIGYSVRW